jgi:hypothetical protein
VAAAQLACIRDPICRDLRGAMTVEEVYGRVEYEFLGMFCSHGITEVRQSRDSCERFPM